MSAAPDPEIAAATLLLGTDREKFTALAAMPRAQYHRLREEMAAGMGVRLDTLDAEVEHLQPPPVPPLSAYADEPVAGNGRRG